MKTDMTTPPAPETLNESQSDSPKLASLLALATAAVAMPQTGNADIVYTDLNSAPAQVGFLGGTTNFQFTLPGTALFGFERFERTVTTTSPFTTTHFFRTVVARDMYGAVPAFIQVAPGGFAAPLTYGAPWDQGLSSVYTAAMGVANSLGHSPNAYDHMYLAWSFVDSTSGNAVRYGWIEVGLSINNVNFTGTSGGPNVTIYGYAYDNTPGAKPTMGQRPVPEPSSAALLIVGAMALGARGVRNWRRNRDVTLKS
jgi:hypothetical protein